MINILQILRGVAALLVVLNHISIPIEFFNETKEGPFGHGVFGVDLFFVISGFIMVATTVEGKSSANPLTFMRNRIIRVVPLYWLITALVFALGIMSPGSFPNSDLSVRGLLTSLFFVPRAISPLVYVGWTLNFEMFFYLIFAGALAFGAKSRVAFTVTAILILVLLGASFKSEDPFFHFFTNPIMIEFLAGVLIGAVYLSRHSWFTFSYPRFSLLGAASIAFLVQFLLPTETNNWWRVIQFAPCSGAIVFCALALENEVDISGWKLPILVGDASYSIYLTHFFIARIYDKLPGFAFAGRSMVAGLTCSAVIVLTAALVGIFVHKLIEKRFDSMLKVKGRAILLGAEGVQSTVSPE